MLNGSEQVASIHSRIKKGEISQSITNKYGTHCAWFKLLCVCHHGSERAVACHSRCSQAGFNQGVIPQLLAMFDED